jgi:hypothetical protein
MQNKKNILHLTFPKKFKCTIGTDQVYSSYAKLYYIDVVTLKEHLLIAESSML